MTFDYLLGGVSAIFITIYLFYALFWPEKF
ncbi:MAG: K(+)-transporting ATPase subunit F [Candidatus Riflebacteria bacterium]|nr:K(+)-transporting ATPase subunit F [Candidatus Riflebacteria bacterium]